MLNNLKIGSRITVVKPYDMTPYKVYGTLEGFYIGKYAQYENTLFLYIKPFRCRRIERVTIYKDEVAYILNKDIKNLWRKEVIESNDKATVSQLHRLTINDFNSNDIIYAHEYGQEIEVNNNYESFIDRTADYMINEGIRNFEAEDNANYIEYIKTLLTAYNVDKLKQYIKNEGYSILEKCINKAVKYNW